jgi:hypothetical protein
MADQSNEREWGEEEFFEIRDRKLVRRDLNEMIQEALEESKNGRLIDGEEFFAQLEREFAERSPSEPKPDEF